MNLPGYFDGCKPASERFHRQMAATYGHAWGVQLVEALHPTLVSHAWEAGRNKREEQERRRAVGRRRHKGETRACNH